MLDNVEMKPQIRHSVLLLPGLCGTYRELGAIPKVLEDSGYHVHIAEIPGYANDQGLIHWMTWVEEVERIFTELKDTSSTVIVVGLSMGATLALKLAERRDDVDGIVLLSPVLRYDGWAIPWWYQPFLLVTHPLGFRSWSYPEREPYGIANLELRRRVHKAVQAGTPSEVGSPTISARHLYQALKLMRDVRLWLQHVQAPTLIIHAVDDETAAPRNAEEILNRIHAEVRRVIWLGDSYHIITVDNEREVVVNETSRFVDECSRKSAVNAGFRDRARILRMKDRRA